MPSGCPFLVTLLLISAGASAGPFGYDLDVFDSDRGLPDSSVTSIAQTSDGYLWIGTYNGLARFDGVRFTTFDPSNTLQMRNARVANLFHDAQGTLWVNTHDLAVLSLRNGVFANETISPTMTAVFSTPSEIQLARLVGGVGFRRQGAGMQAAWTEITLPSNTAYSFSRDSTDTTWFLLRDGKFGRIIGTNAVPMTGTNLGIETIQCLTADRLGQIWVGTSNRIARWTGSAFEDQTPTNGAAEVSSTFLFFTETNGYWAFANGAVRHAVDRKWVRDYEELSDLASLPFGVTALEHDDGSVWFSRHGSGIICIEPRGAVLRFSVTNGLPGDQVTCCFKDREGNIWAGIERGGLVRIRKTPFQPVGINPAFKFPATTICEDSKSNLWIGTIGGGLTRLRNGKIDKRFNVAKDGQNSVASVFPDREGGLWLSADREDLFRLKQDQIVRHPDQIHGIKSILLDSQDRLWLGRRSDLICAEDGKFTYHQPWDKYGRGEARAIAEDARGAIWIGVGNGEIYRCKDGSFTAFKPADGREEQPILALYPDSDGSLWIGTHRGGVLRLRDGKFVRYTKAKGLPSDIISQILDDGRGTLYFGSHRGIFSVSKNAFDAFDRREIASLPCHAYGLSDGLPTLECASGYQPSCWRGHEGTLYFATTKGAVAFDRDKPRFDAVPPQVVIENFLVDGKPFPPGRTNQPPEFPSGMPVGDVRQIPPGRHQFDFQFTAPAFAAPEKIRFRYRLLGLDEEWVDAGPKRSAHYGRLLPGKYTFEVTASTEAGIWNETGSHLNLIQQPFFWQTWWFAAALVSLGSVTLVLLARRMATRKMRQRINHLKQQHAIDRERERIARDIHDDLGAGLTQILLQSSVASRDCTGQARTDLNQITENARDLVRRMDEIVWAVTPEMDTLDGLVTYVCGFVQNFCAAVQLQCRIDVPRRPPNIPLTAEVRHSLYLAIKESLNNVAKHSHATEVHLQLRVRPDSFTFVIRDNGNVTLEKVAVETNRLFSGRGTRNLEERLKNIGGTFCVTTAPENGTQVELTVFLKNKPMS